MLSVLTAAPLQGWGTEGLWYEKYTCDLNHTMCFETLHISSVTWSSTVGHHQPQLQNSIKLLSQPETTDSLAKQS